MYRTPITSTGNLKAGNTVKLDATATFSVLVRSPAGNTPVPGTDYDQFHITGTVDLNNAHLDLSTVPGFVAQAGRMYTIATAATIKGHFTKSDGAILHDGAVIELSLGSFKINYVPAGAVKEVTLTEQAVATTTTLSFNRKSAIYGEPMTITATVKTTGSATPVSSGTVVFQLDNKRFGTAQTVSNGTASITVGNLAPGTWDQHRIVACFTDDRARYEKSDSRNAPATSLTIGKAAATVSLNSNNLTATLGTPSHLTATVKANPSSMGAVAPTGQVQFRFTGGKNPPADKLVSLAPSFDTTSASASFDVSTLEPSASNYSVTATYVPGTDPNYGAGAAQAVTVTVSKAVPIDARVIVNNPRIAVSTTGSYAFQMTGVAGVAPRGGFVIFQAVRDANTVTLGKVPASTFTAVENIYTAHLPDAAPSATLHAGAWSVTAAYDGASDPCYGSATAPTAAIQTVTRGTATVTLNTPANRSFAWGAPQDYTVTVTVPATGAPAPRSPAIVNLYFDPNADSPGTLLASAGAFTRSGNDHTVTFSAVDTSRMAVGDHVLYASFDHDLNYNAVASGKLDIKATRAVAVLSAPTIAHATSVLGQANIYKTALTLMSASLPSPRGQVEFRAVDATDPATSYSVGTADIIGSGTTCTAMRMLVAGEVPMPVGTYRVIATYAGDGQNYGASPHSSATMQRVNPADTSTILHAGSSTMTVSSREGALASVAASSPGSATNSLHPTGTVKFTFSSVSGGRAPAPQMAMMDTATGKAVVDFSKVPGGKYNITAHYLGDINFKASPTASSAITVVITPARTVAELRVSSTPASGTVSTYVFGLTATPASVAPIADPTGNVLFSATSVSGSTSIPLGVARLTRTQDGRYEARLDAGDALPVGAYNITATYAGDNNYARPIDATAVQSVGVAPSTIEITTCPSTIPYGSVPQSYTVTFTSSAFPTPTGAIQLYYDTVDAAHLLATSCAFTRVGTNHQYTTALTNDTIAMPAGEHHLYVVFSGDGNHASSQSNPKPQKVDPVGLGINVRLISLGDTLLYGQGPVTFKPMITTPAHGVPPTKAITLTARNTATGGTIDLGSTRGYSGSAGRYAASVTYGSSIPVGSYDLIVHFPGDANYTRVRATTPAALVVNPAFTTTNLPSGPLIFPYGTGTITATVNVDSPGKGPPAGSVAFFVPGFEPQTVPLSGNTAALDLSRLVTNRKPLATTALLPGIYTVQAAYVGHLHFAPSSAGAVEVSVAVASMWVLTIEPSQAGPRVSSVYRFKLTAPAGLPVPTGTVTFAATFGPETPILLGTDQFQVTDTPGVFVAQVVASLAAGSYHIEAEYEGDTLYGSASDTRPQTVAGGDPPVITRVKAIPSAAPTPMTVTSPVQAPIAVPLPLQVPTPNIVTPAGQPSVSHGVTNGKALATPSAGSSTPKDPREVSFDSILPDLPALTPGVGTTMLQRLDNAFESGNVPPPNHRAATSAVISLQTSQSPAGNRVTLILRITVPIAAAGYSDPTGMVNFTTFFNASTYDLGSTDSLTMDSIVGADAIYLAMVDSTAAQLLTAGPYTIQATYSGDSTYAAPALISPVSLTIQAAPRSRLLSGRKPPRPR